MCHHKKKIYLRVFGNEIISEAQYEGQGMQGKRKDALGNFAFF